VVEGTGGISWTGTADVVQTHVVEGTGGISWTGTADVVQTHVVDGTGGISWSGTADVRRVISVIGEGGISWSGTADVRVLHSIIGDGGISWSGTADVVQTHVVEGDGGISWSGTADVAQMHVVEGDGGISWEGVADVNVVSPGPGPTCLTAMPLAENEEYYGTINVGDVQWFKINLPTGPVAVYTLATAGSPSNMFCTLFGNGDCSTGSGLAGGFLNGFKFYGNRGPGDYWLFIERTGGSDGSYNFHWEMA
jgi:hypothetical protein